MNEKILIVQLRIETVSISIFVAYKNVKLNNKILFRFEFLIENEMTTANTQKNKPVNIKIDAAKKLLKMQIPQINMPHDIEISH